MTQESLPGNDLVRQGIEDLCRGVESVPALLVSIGAPRLRLLGLEVPENVISLPERRLYQLLWSDDPDVAHSRYKHSDPTTHQFRARGGMRKVSDADRIRRFMRAFGAEAVSDARTYFTGGATAVLLGWRDSTIAIDLRIFPRAIGCFARSQVSRNPRDQCRAGQPGRLYSGTSWLGGSQPLHRARGETFLFPLRSLLPGPRQDRAQSPTGSPGRARVDSRKVGRTEAGSRLFRDYRTTTLPLSGHRSAVIPKES